MSIEENQATDIVFPDRPVSAFPSRDNPHYFRYRHRPPAKNRQRLKAISESYFLYWKRTLEFTDGVVTTVSDEAIMDAMAMVSKNGFGCEPASAATVAGTKKLVDQGIIQTDATVVGIATGHILKDTTAIVDYHFNPKNKFANTPITVEPNVSQILKIANS